MSITGNSTDIGSAFLVNGSGGDNRSECKLAPDFFWEEDGNVAKLGDVVIAHNSVNSQIVLYSLNCRLLKGEFYGM